MNCWLLVYIVGFVVLIAFVCAFLGAYWASK
jgi:hypothetical protein